MDFDFLSLSFFPSPSINSRFRQYKEAVDCISKAIKKAKNDEDCIPIRILRCFDRSISYGDG